MAAIYKCTKLLNKGVSPVSPLDYLFQAEYHNPTIPNPPTLSISFSLSKENASTPSNIMDACDEAQQSIGVDYMNWTL